jgi:hypothetical protein
MLHQMQASEGGHGTSKRHTYILLVLEHKFHRDSKIQTFLQNLKQRKWRSAFDIPDIDSFREMAAASIQGFGKDQSKYVKGMLYVTDQHVCFLEDAHASKSLRKQVAVDLGAIQVPASGARLRIKWARGDQVTVSPRDRHKLTIKGCLDAALYQNSCTLSKFKTSNVDSSGNTYLKCCYDEQQYDLSSVFFFFFFFDVLFILNQEKK